MTSIASKMLRDAAGLVSGPRADTHGDILSSYKGVARIWSAYLINNKSRLLTASDVASMMELLKITRRQSGQHNPDDYVDGAGYAAVSLECKERELADEQSPLATEIMKSTGDKKTR